MRLCGKLFPPVAVGILGVTLDTDESEAIAMSLEWPADLLIMDESSGRAMANNLNIRITGTLGVLSRLQSYPEKVTSLP